jgi:hypothetical protein
MCHTFATARGDNRDSSYTLDKESDPLHYSLPRRMAETEIDHFPYPVYKRNRDCLSVL